MKIQAFKQKEARNNYKGGGSVFTIDSLEKSFIDQLSRFFLSLLLGQ